MNRAPQFTLLSRDGCELCEEMLAALQTFCGSSSGQVDVVDVDADERLRTRFGHRVPVLLLDGLPVCHGQFDADELRRLLRER